MTNQYVYDNYEISGCYRVEDADPVRPGRSFVERCDDDAEAQFWTLYGHIDGQGAQAIGDFDSRDAAEAVYRRIVGEPFTGSYEANPRLRLMHAAPMLLAACEMVTERWETGDLAEAARHCGDAIHEATTAGPPWVSAEPDIHRWLARKHQIASIWWIEDVQGIRPDLTCKQAWEVLRGYPASLFCADNDLRRISGRRFEETSRSGPAAQLSSVNSVADTSRFPRTNSFPDSL